MGGGDKVVDSEKSNNSDACQQPSINLDASPTYTATPSLPDYCSTSHDIVETKPVLDMFLPTVEYYLGNLSYH